VPELPEVESLVRGVRAKSLGGKCVGVTFYRDDIREVMNKRIIRKVLLGNPITHVQRRGKYMLIATKEGALGVHLGMSGKFILTHDPKPSASHTHVVFELTMTDKQVIFYHFIDPRRFGRIFSLSQKEFTSYSHPFLADLGVEPLDPAVDLSAVFFKLSRGRKTPIKTFIMDSKMVVGDGNIYASEALWRAKISPFKSAGLLDQTAYKALAKEIQFVLVRSIEAGGTTFRDYRNSDNQKGAFQVKLAVYNREGLPCLTCKAKIERSIQAGRSTFFCSVCQV